MPTIFCYCSNSGQTQARSDCPLSARNEILRGNNEREIRRLQICINLLSANRYSITSSARQRGLSANVRRMVLIAIDRRSNYMNVRAVQREIVLQMCHRNLPAWCGAVGVKIQRMICRVEP